MRAEHETSNINYIININSLKIETIFSNNRIWLSKNEISKIYNIDKWDIKIKMKEILLNSNLEILENTKKVLIKGESKTYYSLDLILLFWYINKSFNQTKSIIQWNKAIKEYNIARKQDLNKLNIKSTLKNIIHLFNRKYI